MLSFRRSRTALVSTLLCGALAAGAAAASAAPPKKAAPKKKETKMKVRDYAHTNAVISKDGTLAWPWQQH